MEEHFMNVRMDVELLEAIRAKAKANDRSIGAEIRNILRREIGMSQPILSQEELALCKAKVSQTQPKP